MNEKRIMQKLVDEIVVFKNLNRIEVWKLMVLFLRLVLVFLIDLVEYFQLFVQGIGYFFRQVESYKFLFIEQLVIYLYFLYLVLYFYQVFLNMFYIICFVIYYLLFQVVLCLFNKKYFWNFGFILVYCKIEFRV